MTLIWSMLVLALAVSLDGFSAGVLYGARKIRIPAVSVIIVSICSALVLYASMGAGGVLARWLPERAGRWIGASILIAIGIWAIVQMALTSRREAAASAQSVAAAQSAASEQSAAPDATGGQELCAAAPAGDAADPAAPAAGAKRVLQFEIRPLGLIIRIWRTPSMADVDRSGTISASEAVLLGLALSLDSLGAGIGAALIGFPPAVTAAVIGAACGLCIAAGAKLGFLISGTRWLGKLTLLPGCILIVMGFMKFM